MTLRIAQPPPGATAAILDRLAGMSENPQNSRRAIGGSDPAGVTLEAPHEVYTLGLADLLSADPLGASAVTGWRYLLHDATNAVSAAETVVSGSGEHRFASFNSGPFVASTLEALRSTADLPLAQAEDLEPRLLSVPALHLMALWLHGATQDVLTPLAPVPPGVAAGRAYAPADLFEILRPQATSRVSVGPDDLTGG